MSKETTATSADLIKQSEELRKQGEALKAKEAPSVLGRIKEAIAHYGFTAADLGLTGAQVAKKTRRSKLEGPAKKVAVTKRKGSSVPKFRDAAGHSWTGFGPKPKWFKEALAAGATVESLKA